MYNRRIPIALRIMSIHKDKDEREKHMTFATSGLMDNGAGELLMKKLEILLTNNEIRVNIKMTKIS